MNIPEWVPAVARPYVAPSYNDSVGQIYIWKNSTVEIQGFKGFDGDMKCRHIQYKLNELKECRDNIILCYKGLHFCLDAIDVDAHYKLNIQSNNILCRVTIPIGSEIHFSENKCVANKLIPVKSFIGTNIFPIIDGIHLNKKSTFYIEEGIQHRTEGPCIIHYNNSKDSNQKNENENVSFCRWMTRGVYNTREQINRPTQLIESVTNENLLYFCWANNCKLVINQINYPNEVKMLKELLWSNKKVDFIEDDVSYESLIKRGIGTKCLLG